MLQKKFKLFQYKLSTHKQYIFHKKFSLTRKKRGKNHEHCIITATVHYMYVLQNVARFHRKSKLCCKAM